MPRDTGHSWPCLTLFVSLVLTRSGQLASGDGSSCGNNRLPNRPETVTIHMGIELPHPANTHTLLLTIDHTRKVNKNHTTYNRLICDFMYMVEVWGGWELAVGIVAVLSNIMHCFGTVESMLQQCYF